jgi:hypothetical protein
MEKKDLTFDRRLLQRNLKTGLISKKEYERFLKELPDRQAECEEDYLFSKPSSSTEENKD